VLIFVIDRLIQNSLRAYGTHAGGDARAPSLALESPDKSAAGAHGADRIYMIDRLGEINQNRINPV